MKASVLLTALVSAALAALAARFGVPDTHLDAPEAEQSE